MKIAKLVSWKFSLVKFLFICMTLFFIGSVPYIAYREIKTVAGFYATAPDQEQMVYSGTIDSLGATVELQSSNYFTLKSLSGEIIEPVFIKPENQEIYVYIGPLQIGQYELVGYRVYLKLQSGSLFYTLPTVAVVLVIGFISVISTVILVGFYFFFKDAETRRRFFSLQS